MIFWVTMGWTERQLYIRLNHDFARYSRYENAVAAFARRKREHEARLAKQQAEYWRSLSGIGFERELGKLFSLMGYAVTHTPSTADGGVDLLLRKGGNLTVVQCKAHNKRISISVARELFASMMDFEADDAIIACLEGVTKPVVDYIKTKRITVMTLNNIIEHQMKHG
jgi:restriction system protein